jgi:hypothetical protein
MRFESMLNPYLIAKINGREIKSIGFTLLTIAGTPFIQSKIYIEKNTNCSLEDEIEVYLGYTNQSEWKVFTGWIECFYESSNMKVAVLRDGTKKFWVDKILESYRKEKAKNILDDCLALSGVNDKKVTMLDVEFARYLLNNQTNNDICEGIIASLYSHGEDKKLQYFFDQNNTFHFGSIEDTGVNESEKFSFDEKNILRKLKQGFETFALPVRHSQKITVNNEEKTTTKTLLNIFPKNSYSEIYYE